MCTPLIPRDTAGLAGFPAILFLFVTFLLPSIALAAASVTVEISGVKGELLSNVRAHLSLDRRRNEEGLKERWIRILHDQAPGEIRAALEPFGYYNVQLTESLEQSNGRWIARYALVLGEPVRISSLHLFYSGDGAEEVLLKAAIESFPLQPGEVLDHARYEQARDSLVEAAMQLGYAKATLVDARVTVDPQSNSATINLQVETGPRYFFGQVRIHQDFLNQGLVEEFVTLKAGEPYNTNRLLAFQQGLQATEWASVVQVDPRFEEAVERQVPLDVTLRPSNRHRFLFGIGYDSDTGPRGSARWIHRRINRSGHHAEVALRLSAVRRTLQGSYYIPIRDPRTDRLAPTVQYEYEETSDTRRNTFTGEVAFVRRSLDDRDFYRAFLELRNEVSQVQGEAESTSNLLSIGFNRRFTELQPVIFPRSGKNYFFNLRGASSELFSDTSYLRLFTGGKLLLPVKENGRFRVHGQLGASVVEFFDRYPTSLRFFAGGDNSIRGYDYKSLGPVDENGNVVGGKNLLLLSGEYEHRVDPQWALASFVDSGNAYDDKLDKIYTGAGVGFRWLSRFGSLRVDFAWPVSEADTELKDGLVHLGFGMVL